MHCAATRMEIHGVDWTVSQHFQVWLVLQGLFGAPIVVVHAVWLCQPLPLFYASCVCPMDGINQ